MGAPQYEQAGADVAGSGTTGTIPVWSTGTTLGNSGITDDGSVVTTTRRFDVNNSNGIRVQVQGDATRYTRFTQFGSQLIIDCMAASGEFRLRTNQAAIEAMYATFQGSIGLGTTTPATGARLHVAGNAVAASGTTTMTDGFFYIPAAAGAPTGVPTAIAGRVPMYYDTTNDQFYIRNGANWRKVTLT
jgi:hypothetical protein